MSNPINVDTLPLRTVLIASIGTHEVVRMHPVRVAGQPAVWNWGHGCTHRLPVVSLANNKQYFVPVVEHDGHLCIGLYAGSAFIPYAEVADPESLAANAAYHATLAQCHAEMRDGFARAAEDMKQQENVL